MSKRFDKALEITKCVWLQDGLVSFELDSDPALASLLPAKAVRDMEEKFGDKWVEASFAAILDCRTFDAGLHARLAGSGSARLDYDLDLYPSERAWIRHIINKWCKARFGETIEAVADAHLESYGLSPSLKDYAVRFKNYDFSQGESCAVKEAGSEEDKKVCAGVAMSFLPSLPGFLRKFSGLLRENGILGLTQIKPLFSALTLSPLAPGVLSERSFPTLTGIGKDEMSEILLAEPDLGHYKRKIFVDPETEEMVFYVKPNGSREDAVFYFSFSEMEEAAKPREDAIPKM